MLSVVLMLACLSTLRYSRRLRLFDVLSSLVLVVADTTPPWATTASACRPTAHQIRPSCGPTARAMMLVDRSDEKKWCHRASLRSTSCSGKTTVPSGSTSNSGACANRASSGQLEDVRHPCITRGQWGGMPRPLRPTARPWPGTDRRRFEEP